MKIIIISIVCVLIVSVLLILYLKRQSNKEDEQENKQEDKQENKQENKQEKSNEGDKQEDKQEKSNNVNPVRTRLLDEVDEETYDELVKNGLDLNPSDFINAGVGYTKEEIFDHHPNSIMTGVYLHSHPTKKLVFELKNKTYETRVMYLKPDSSLFRYNWVNGGYAPPRTKFLLAFSFCCSSGTFGTKRILPEEWNKIKGNLSIELQQA